MADRAKQLLTKLPPGPCRCATAPDGEPWASPSDTDRWADDGGRNNDGECNFIGKCARCGGKYRIEIVEEIVDVIDPELSPAGAPL